MREIGVRELKAALSETLRAVGRGEAVRVTVRGRAVADIVPAGTREPADPLAALIANGRITPPSEPRPARAPRLARRRGALTAADAVLAERDSER